MNWRKAGLTLLCGGLAFGVHAEYRAYELEIFDRTTNESSVIVTTFSPADYIATHGGPDRTGVIIRASWICYGDTSSYQKVCPMPQAVNPAYEEGDRVQVMLPQHLTDQWVGVVENRFFRPELRSNVYGIRFPDRGGLYTRYYEVNLRKAP
ncbi:MAG: hypothetical protein ACO4AU_10690 [bacterium]|jgi:hypothetical protein